ncbi:hypothetical protein Lal_00019085 [Lupinus albus]|nr:hypothetical protein Lal_00019085 [Lupinus albus]
MIRFQNLRKQRGQYGIVFFDYLRLLGECDGRFCSAGKVGEFCGDSSGEDYSFGEGFEGVENEVDGRIIVRETFGTPQAQAAWSITNPATFIQRKGIDSHIIGCIDLSIHSKIESFNPINLDNIFQEDYPLSKWTEERENPTLDGAQNAS